MHERRLSGPIGSAQADDASTLQGQAGSVQDRASVGPFESRVFQPQLDVHPEGTLPLVPLYSRVQEVLEPLRGGRTPLKCEHAFDNSLEAGEGAGDQRVSGHHGADAQIPRDDQQCAGRQDRGQDGSVQVLHLESDPRAREPEPFDSRLKAVEEGQNESSEDLADTKASYRFDPVDGVYIGGV